MKRSATPLLAFGLISVADGHGAMVEPRSRNSVDWAEVPDDPSKGIHNTGERICQNLTGAACNNGQAQYWYSQGCFIGCDECDHKSGRRQTDLCKAGFVGQLPDYAIAVNRNASAGFRDGPYDIYRHNPWRAPGNAPVADACGLAGGTPWGGDAPEEGQYVNTTHARHGMKGTTLPPLETGTVWKAGGEAEVVFAVKFNHGGGYAYRLCPAEEELTEACFQRTHLAFNQGKQALVFKNGSRLPIARHSVFVSEGTYPQGSMWTRIPIPTGGLGPRCQCDMDNNYHVCVRSPLPALPSPASSLARSPARPPARLSLALSTFQRPAAHPASPLPPPPPPSPRHAAAAGRLQLRLQDGRAGGRLHHAGQLLLRRLRAVPGDGRQRLLALRQPAAGHAWLRPPHVRAAVRQGVPPAAPVRARRGEGARRQARQVRRGLPLRLRRDGAGLEQLRGHHHRVSWCLRSWSVVQCNRGGAGFFIFNCNGVCSSMPLNCQNSPLRNPS